MVFCLSGCYEESYENALRITSAEFPIVLEYEIDGQRFIIEDIIVCEFEGYYDIIHYPGIPYKRSWDWHFKSGNEIDGTLIEFEKNSRSV